MPPDLGTAPLAPDDTRCPQLPMTQVEVHDQNELEALRGCTSIAGDLTIFPFAGADLTPLAQLERVGGTFTLGDPYEGSPPPTFASLEGLESLRSVGSLVLRGVGARSLGPLSGLTQLGTSGGITPLSGYVIIDHCPAITDLSGLDDLEGLLGFIASSDAALVSIRGLRVPRLLNQFEIWDSPVNDISAARALQTVSISLSLTNTALSDVADLAALADVGELQLSNNLSLTDLSGLAGLWSAHSLAFDGNPRLESVPEFPLLSTRMSLFINDNPLLLEVLGMPRLRSIESARFSDNPLLSRLLALSAVESAGDVYVDGNPALTELDLGRLSQVERFLRITHNAAFDSASVPRPTGGGVIIGGNRGEPLELAPCPWSGNAMCEGPPEDDLCALGADTDCDGL
jgi:hypothetical protein